MQTVDVIIPTKNSMKPCFAECLESVRRSVPVNQIIVVDGGSDDGTAEYALSKGCVVINDSRGTRATARDKGIAASQTEFFVLLDSDVVLEQGWFDKIRGSIEDPRVGAVCGFLYPTNKHALNVYRSMAAMYGIGAVPNLAKYSTFAGSNALVRKSGVDGLRTPLDLDDTYIGEYLRSRGYLVNVLPTPVAFHFRGRETETWECFSAGFMMRKYRMHNRHLSYFLRRVFVNGPVEFLWITFHGRDPWAAYERYRNNVYTIGGYILRSFREQGTLLLPRAQG